MSSKPGNNKIETNPAALINNTQHDSGTVIGHSQHDLAPADRGARAWRFLAGSFAIEAFIWGYDMCFGVFQGHYIRLDSFKDNPNIPVIGTVATSIVFLGTPFAAPLLRKYHQWRQFMVVFGSVLCVVACIWASFANSIAELIASQGALYGTGVLVVYAPLVSLLNEWFVDRRGFAYGVVFAGGGLSGVGLPFLVEWLLASYGYRTTFRVLAVAEAVCVAPILPMIKSRLPSAGKETAKVSLDFLSNPLFWVLSLSNLLQGFAIYVPSIYLPTFATMAGLSPRIGALLLAALNLASTIGQVVFGHLSDRYDNVYVLAFITTFMSALSTFFLWGFGSSLAPLLLQSIIFGFFGGSYVVLWPKFALLSKDHVFLYGIMAFGKGVGNFATGPITSRMLDTPQSSGYGLGSYKSVILYTGILLVASSFGIIGWPMKRRMNRADARLGGQ